MSSLNAVAPGFESFQPFDISDADPTRASKSVPDWGGYCAEAEQASLLICSGQYRGSANLARIDALACAVGYRILDAVSIELAAARLAMLVDVDVILVSCTGAEPGIESLLARADMMTQAQGTRLIVITGMEGLDLVDTAVQSHSSTILCDPAPEDMLAALCAAATSLRGRERLYDVGSNDEADHFEQLSGQIARLSRTIEALVQERIPDKIAHDGANHVAVRSPGRKYASPPASLGAGEAALSGRQVRAMLRARRLRDHMVAPDLFADPAWDILLDLMAARLEGTQVSVSSLCIAAAVPPTTALRWIRQLTDRGFLLRHADPKDGRRIFIALSDQGADAISRWFHGSRGYLLLALGLGDEAPETANLPA